MNEITQFPILMNLSTAMTLLYFIVIVPAVSFFLEAMIHRNTAPKPKSERKKIRNIIGSFLCVLFLLLLYFHLFTLVFAQEAFLK